MERGQPWSTKTNFTTTATASVYQIVDATGTQIVFLQNLFLSYSGAVATTNAYLCEGVSTTGAFFILSGATASQAIMNYGERGLPITAGYDLSLKVTNTVTIYLAANGYRRG